MDRVQYRSQGCHLAGQLRRLGSRKKAGLPMGPACTGLVERETGFEPATSTLARLHSTTELLPRIWRRHPDLNRRMEVLQTSALPLGYAAPRKGKTPLVKIVFTVNGALLGAKKSPPKGGMERETGFEPATSTLARLHSTAELLPLAARGAFKWEEGAMSSTGKGNFITGWISFCFWRKNKRIGRKLHPAVTLFALCAANRPAWDPANWVLG
jgi:hypothetical protein